MKLQKLLSKARPAVSAICPGCERSCVIPVHTLTRAHGSALSFVVCDKRDDINRVSVGTERLIQWRCNTAAVCGFIARSLELRRSEQRPADATILNIGMAWGKKGNQMLCLRADGNLTHTRRMLGSKS